jgi:Flp pilus assembly protein TadG
MSLFRFARRDDGQMVVLAALMLTVLIFLVGIAVDLGVLFVQRRTAQEAADAGAFAGAVILYNGGTNLAAENAAIADITLNGFTTGVNATTVTVHSPPLSGSHILDINFIQVTISQQVQTPLLPQEGGTTTIGVYAVGGKTTRTTSYALMTIDSAVPQSLNIANSATLTVNGGDIQVDSSATPPIAACSATTCAATKGGLGLFTIQLGHAARAVGGATGFLPGQFLTGQPSIPDPFAAYLRPACCTGVSSYPGQSTNSGSVTLNPGIYSCASPCTGALSFGGTAAVTMNPGIYILTGGLSTTGSASLSGSGVMIFNTLQNYPTETGTCGPISLQGGAALSLSPPTTGYYKGMLLFQDRTCTQQVLIQGSLVVQTATGTVYVPRATVRLAGNSTTSVGQIIANNISIAPQAALTVTYDPTTSAQPPAPTLVE